METLIKDKNLRLTSARASLLKILIDAKKPLCYEELKERIAMDKTTFYRNMNIFEEKGIIRSFESSDKKRYHELTSPIHAHFICSVCNGIACIENYPVPKHIKGAQVDTVIVKGTCASCCMSFD
ncbi:MAG: transcriptional repressor [Campylobacterales bacterium]|nr:transcriptional repressor [Campylobacterales bacterium]